MNKFLQNRWDSLYGDGASYLQYNSQELDDIFSAIGKHGTLRILDVACGKGELIKQLTERGFECEGIDISSVALKEARTLNPDATFYHIDIERDSSFTKGHRRSYDVIFIKLAVAFIHDVTSVLTKCKQMLKNDGHLIVTTPVWNENEKNTRKNISVDERVFMKEVLSIFSSIDSIKRKKKDFGVVVTYEIKP